jgi:hypothetical protein
MKTAIVFSFITITFLLHIYSANAQSYVDFSDAVVFVDSDGSEPVLENSARVLIEEVEKRTGILWHKVNSVPNTGAHIVIRLAKAGELKPEGYRITLDQQSGPRLLIESADPRASLYGVGHLLRKSMWNNERFDVPVTIETETAPKYPYRGFELGYRSAGNPYVTWDRDQYEQYIRELALFGANAVQNTYHYFYTPDDIETPVQVMSRHEMNRNISEICEQYGLEFWMWSPGRINLYDEEMREDVLRKVDVTYSNLPRIDAVFYPGGDGGTPGKYPPGLVLPFLSELSAIIQRHHPQAMLWFSMQGFQQLETVMDTVDDSWIDATFEWLEAEDSRAWFGGLMHGPGSPDPSETRRRLADHYSILHYPDITHIVRAQYQHNQLDPLFSISLTRQGINPQPRHSQFIHNRFAPFTNGFIAYSDGTNDDVNKVVWARLGWDPGENLREILMDYGRFFFRPDLSEDVADAIIALEQNFDGPALDNGGIVATMHEWERIGSVMEDELKGAGANWRLQMMLFRATIDAYARYRLIYEQGLEEQACLAILEYIDDPEKAVKTALSILKRAETEGVRHDLRKRIISMADDLWQSTGLQTDPEAHHARITRGAVLHYLDTPLNSRYWIEDQFGLLQELDEDAAVRNRLYQIALWQNPGEGSFYNDLGNVGKSPNVMYTGGPSGHPMQYRQPMPLLWPPDGERARHRYGWLHAMSNPVLLFEHIDPEADYLFRVAGNGDSKPRAEGELLEPLAYDTSQGGFKDFFVPRKYYADGTLKITFDILDECQLNWRERSYMSEVWLLKQ